MHITPVRSRSIVVTLIALVLTGAGVAVATLVAWPEAEAAQCGLIDEDTGAPEGFGQPYKVVDGSNRMLIDGSCRHNNISVTVGDDRQDTWVYNRAFYWANGRWNALTLSGSGRGGSWLEGSGDVSYNPQVPTNEPSYFVGYLCHSIGGTWKCGCADAACNQSLWQMQAFLNLEDPYSGTYQWFRVNSSFEAPLVANFLLDDTSVRPSDMEREVADLYAAIALQNPPSEPGGWCSSRNGCDDLRNTRVSSYQTPLGSTVSVSCATTRNCRWKTDNDGDRTCGFSFGGVNSSCGGLYVSNDDFLDAGLIDRAGARSFSEDASLETLGVEEVATPVGQAGGMKLRFYNGRPAAYYDGRRIATTRLERTSCAETRVRYRGGGPRDDRTRETVCERYNYRVEATAFGFQDLFLLEAFAAALLEKHFRYQSDGDYYEIYAPGLF